MYLSGSSASGSNRAAPPVMPGRFGVCPPERAECEGGGKCVLQLQQQRAVQQGEFFKKLFGSEMTPPAQFARMLKVNCCSLLDTPPAMRLHKCIRQQGYAATRCITR